MQLNDCKECEHFSQCYDRVSNVDTLEKALVAYMSALWRRDLCVNNEKRAWREKRV